VYVVGMYYYRHAHIITLICMVGYTSWTHGSKITDSAHVIKVASVSNTRKLGVAKSFKTVMGFNFKILVAYKCRSFSLTDNIFLY